ncbi:MAG: rhomboid family intramembrane serine protease [Bacteroidetes bacterium]|nr:rhomboid family intramembrane serine protease [Bacteroidota bacterium]
MSFSIVFVLILWIVKLFETFTQIDLGIYGVYPRDITGLRGIVFYPFLHADFTHLISNTAPIFVLSFILFLTYQKIAWRVFLYIYILSGLGIWIFARPSIHLGASGLIYGLASFVFFSGVFRRDIRSVALSFLIIFLYGGMIWGVLPLQQGVSWEGHLFGALAGAYCAYYYRDINKPTVPDWMKDKEDDMNYEPPFWLSNNS